MLGEFSMSSVLTPGEVLSPAEASSYLHETWRINRTPSTLARINAQLESPFNSWLSNKLLIVGEEIDVSHDRALAARMKELITGDRVQINKKHVPEAECPNLA